MSFEKVLEELPSVVEQFREENEIKLHTIIKDDIFRLLNKYCIIIYYPLEDESNWGFRTKRFVNGKLEDFVFINTARTLAEQVFIAAHELGHVWDVNSKLADIAPESKNLTAKEEEDIIDRFAAELLMPPQRFKGSFMENIMLLGLNTKVIRIEDLIRVMVLLLGDFTLHIYNAVDLVMQVAEKDELPITKKELEQILACMGERSHRAELTNIWKEHH